MVKRLGERDVNMRKATKQITIVAIAALLLGGIASTAAAQGLVGQCADCHTMHNSEQGKPVALQGSSTTASATPNPNLLKMDCIACHASGGGEMVRVLDGGSRIPQVLHTAATDLAAGNFRHITTGGDRKGHNVIDVVSADSTFTRPPGYKDHDPLGFTFDVSKLTCAGNMGCHGIRGQQLDPGDPFLGTDPTYRTGLAALSGNDGPTATSTTYFSGAHHSNYDGLKSDGAHPEFYENPLAHSYRFIRGLKGYGNMTDRWQNIDSASHNEYSGGYVSDTIKNTDFGTTTTCNRCHLGNQSTTARLYVPNSSVTGFCITCHGSFHSSGATNGSSGAFLRHPSDYVIPNDGEYANYTAFDVTAPVARPAAGFVTGFTPSADVNAGTDMVMCLSCHVPHASPYDGMLRFDYDSLTSKMRAGSFASIEAAQAEGGCFACHTTKGVTKGL